MGDARKYRSDAYPGLSLILIASANSIRHEILILYVMEEAYFFFFTHSKRKEHVG